MELVKGVQLTTFCDERRLDTTRRLELFLQVCSAVNHAHQKGIIHRDLKPSNILVTVHGDDPVPKIIDFGIAKATQHQLTEKTLFTRFEQFIGTPVYMSPEQAAISGLDVDTRADIYSLGVLLYELLSGTPPFDHRSLRQAGYDEMRRIIREVDPPKPSTRLASLQGEERTTITNCHRDDPGKLGGILRGDMDWIVMKALEKDRARRYETANGLAQDIKRFLRDEPVSAAAPSTSYRLGKFARRHKGELAAAAAIALALIAGTAVSIWQAGRAKDEADRTRRALAELRASAPAYLNHAHASIDMGDYEEAIRSYDYLLKLGLGKEEYVTAKETLQQTLPYLERLRNAGVNPELRVAKDKGLKITIKDGSFDDSKFTLLKGAPISALSLTGTGVSVLPGIKDIPRLRSLSLADTHVKDLAPLQGLHLVSLNLGWNRMIRDVEPLRGMPLETLELHDTGVSDIGPLEGMPLRTLYLWSTGVTDVSVLEGMEHLRTVTLPQIVDDFEPLRGLKALERISFWWTGEPSMTAGSFWAIKPRDYVDALRALQDRKWEDAQEYFADFGQTILRDRENSARLIAAGVVLALGTDTAPYNDFRDELLTEFEDERNPDTLEHIAKVALMSSSERSQTERIYRMMTRVPKAARKSGFHAITLALAEYRMGDYRTAADKLDELFQNEKNSLATTLASVVHAMALSELEKAGQLTGRDRKPSDLLEEARQKVETQMARFEKLPPDNWHDILLSYHLLKEARENKR